MIRAGNSGWTDSCAISKEVDSQENKEVVAKRETSETRGKERQKE